jgi:tRNA-splicing ligase RtcB
LAAYCPGFGHSDWRSPKKEAGWSRLAPNEAKVELRGGGVDESPHCYKRLPDVLAEHANSVRVLHTLRSLGVAMAGKDVYDPFKD